MYVDRYCNQYGLTVDEALEHEIVKSVAEQYREKEEARVEQSITDIIQHRYGSGDSGREKDGDKACDEATA